MQPERCRVCPGCGHCVHDHGLIPEEAITTPEGFSRYNAILGCYSCETGACPAEEHSEDRRRVLAEMYRLAIGQGLRNTTI